MTQALDGHQCCLLPSPQTWLLHVRKDCPEITDSAIRKWSSPFFQGREMRLSVGGGPGPPGVINGIRRPTRCSRRCQEMIAYKMYQLPSRLPAHHAARQTNTSAASLHLPGLGEGPVSRSMGRVPRQRQEDHPSPTSPPQLMTWTTGTGGGAFATGETAKCVPIKTLL